MIALYHLWYWYGIKVPPPRYRLEELRGPPHRSNITCVQGHFFFLPTPSWLSPGRFTSLYFPEINCEKHAMPSIGKAAKESECGPLHSPYSCPSAVNHTKRKTNQNKNTTSRKQPKRNSPKNHGNSCVADRLPVVVVRFPAGPRVSLKL